MANYTPPAVTRQSLLQDYMDTLNNWQSDYKSNSNASAMSNFNRLGKLRDLISMVDSGDSSSSEFINPFGAGGGSSAPAMSTDNRFSAGLSDAESRLRALLDNPDSINKSAAYKFRVGQGAEAAEGQPITLDRPAHALHLGLRDSPTIGHRRSPSRRGFARR